MLSPKAVVRLISYWPPLLFSGIKVVDFSDDLSFVRVRLKSRFWNKNFFGTHYGGSLFSMCDPFYLFMLLQHLNKEHIVWDLRSDIHFISAVGEPVFAEFRIEKAEIDNIRQQALENYKVTPSFSTHITTASNMLVAKVTKTIYIRRKDAKQRFANKD